MRSHLPKAKTAGIILAVLGILAFLIGVISGAVHINRQYPQATVHTVSMDDTLTIDNFDITVHDFTLTRFDQFAGQNPEVIPEDYEAIAPPDQTVVVIADITIKNNAGQTRSFSLDQTSIATLTWSNGFDMDLLFGLNGAEASSCPEIKANQEISMRLPCMIYQSQVTKTQWEHLHNEQFELIFSLYPVKNSIQLSGR